MTRRHRHSDKALDTLVRHHTVQVDNQPMLPIYLYIPTNLNTKLDHKKQIWQPASNVIY